MLSEEVRQHKNMVLEITEVHMVIELVQVPEERIPLEQSDVRTIKEQQHDMAHKIVRHTKELKVEQQPEEERVTIQNLKAIHVHRIISQEQDDRQIREGQVLERLDTVKLKVRLVIIKAQQGVQREVLRAHTDLHHHHHHVPQELFVLHQDHQIVEVVQLEVRVEEDDKLLLNSGY